MIMATPKTQVIAIAKPLRTWSGKSMMIIEIEASSNTINTPCHHCFIFWSTFFSYCFNISSRISIFNIS